MSNYWKKKLDELNQKEEITPSKTKASSDYWGNKLTELEQENAKKDDIAPVVTKTAKEDEGNGDFWDWLGNSSMSGLASFNKGITATADLILGKPLQALGWENNPISSIADYYSDSYDHYKGKANEEADKLDDPNKSIGKSIDGVGLGNRYDLAGSLIEGTVAAVPMAIEAMMTGGLSLGKSILGTAGGAATSNLATQAAYRSGNLLTKAGLTVENMARNPQFWTSFAQTYGTDYEEAKKQLESKEAQKAAKAAFHGEEYEEDDADAKIELIATLGATITSLLNAGVEIGITGGSGIQGLPSKVAEGGKSAIFEWVKSSLEEGGEEIVQGVISRGVNKAMYGSEEAVLDGWQMLQEGATGTIVGGLLGGGQIGAQGAINAVQQAQENKLTDNEQKVVDKVVEKRIAEEELAGKPVTTTEKKAIEKQVKDELLKGGISIDTIEEALGGDTYKAYKDTIDGEMSLQKEYDTLKSEYDTLNGMKRGDMTGVQQDRQAELKQQMDELKARIEDKDAIASRDQLKTQLGDEVFSIAKDSRLVESYNERARRGVAYEADLSKYDAKQQKVIQKAVDSGILNNTRRTHEFVDMIARISADKGVLFDFANNEKLKEYGYTVEGATVNGVKTDDGSIVLNINAAKSLNSVTGHEITHILEGTELYDKLQEAAFAYAETKGEYDNRLDALTKLYRGKKGYETDFDKKVLKELTADLVGDYLFTDEAFIKKLSVEHRNVFQKVYDEVKYLLKVATAGSAEARELEKVKKVFEDVYRGEAKSISDTKYSLENVKKRKYNKHSRYSETESLFLQWENGSTPVGEVKRFVRYGKIRYFEKTENGCVELSKSQYIERNGADVENTYRRAEREIGEINDYDVSTQRGMFGDSDSSRNAERNVAVFGQTIREELRYDTARGTSSTLGYGNRNDINQSVLFEEAPDNSGASSFIPNNNDVQYSLTDNNITDVSTGYASGETYYTMAYKQDGKVVATLNYGEYDGAPNVKMIEVEPEYRRKGIGTKLLQALQQKYPDSEIDFGMATPDGVKLLDSITYDVTDEKVVADRQKLKDMQSELNELQEKLDILYDTENLTEAQEAEMHKLGDRWEEVYDSIRELEPTLRGKKATKTFVRYSLSAEADKSYLEAANRGDVATAQKMVDEAAKNAGYDRLMFHETDADNIHIFDVTRGTHGGTDSETPYGIFTKSSVKNIGLGGKQMALYVNAKNTLNVENRAEVKEKIPELIPYYDEITRIDQEYDALAEEYEDAEFEALQEWMDENPDADMDVVYPTSYIIEKKPADIDSQKYLDAHRKHNETMEAWTREYDKLVVKCKEIITEHLRNNGYDSMYFKVDGGSRGRQTDSLILLDPNQVKSAAPITRDDNGNIIPLSQRFNAENDDIRYSLSAEGETPKTYGNYNVRGEDIALETAQEVAPVQEAEDVAPVQAPVTTPKDEADELISAIMDEEFRLQGYEPDAEPDNVPTTEAEANAMAEKHLRRITDADVPPEVEAPYQGESEPMTADDPFSSRNWHERGTKAFITDNPDAKPFFQAEAQRLADDYAYTMPAERGFNGEQYYNTNGEKGFYGWSRQAANDINTLIDVYGLSYAQIEEGLDAIINDTDKVNNKPAKTIEFILNDRMLKGYETYYSGEYVAPNQGYIEWLNGQRQSEEYSEIANTITDADAPMVDDIAPVMKSGTSSLMEIANNGRRDNLKGAYTQDGKQYISDGSFIAEFNTVDKNLATAKDFPAKKVLAELNEAEARQTDGNYSIDGDAVAALNNGDRNFIKVGDSLFDAKYVDALIRAIDSPVFTMSNVHGGDNALFVVGSNGRAVLMPVRAGDNVSVSYEAQPIMDSLTVEDVMPIAEDIAPVKYEAIKPQKPPRTVEQSVEKQPRMVRADNTNAKPNEKQRKWVGTSTESEAVNREILPDDLDQKAIHYQPIPNKVTLGKANTRLDGMGYDKAVDYFNSQFSNKKTTLEDIALGERLIQEAIKKGDTKTAGELIQNVAILGTELGQKVQALSIIKRLTPEGQLKMLQKVVERGKTKGDKAYEGVELTQEMIDKILKAYNKDGSFDQAKLNKAVEDVKQDIANKMTVTKLDKVNAWRYLSMLGNPKTHIRNLVSNVAMRGTVAVKNVIARTVEDIAPIENRTKTWKRATDEVRAFAEKTTAEMQDILRDGGKYSEDASIKEKRKIFKSKILNGLYEFNSDMLSREDWWFSKPAFTNAIAECLTANGIRTEEDILLNPEIVEKARRYATEQSQIATFRQYSWLANKINEIERHNAATNIAVGAILPFKKTPINIAKTGLNYSPLGFAKTLTYDIAQVKNGKMESSELVDHLAQNITGTALTLVGFMLASSGFLSGGGEDDKEGEYDYQLGEQAYSVNIGGNAYSLSWLSPVAMPLFVGANAYDQLVEGKEWNGDVVVETLAQTLDPLSEMSFISSLDSVLSSYDSGIEKFAGIGQSMAQNYATQFVPTLSSQFATVMDDTKRSTKVAGDSGFKFVDETINKLKLKIPFLRETLEPSTDIWGNDVKQTENVITRAFETFIAPYSKREDITSTVDEEIKSLYSETGDDGLIPSIPYNYVNYKDEKYKMSAKEYTAYKNTYGQTAFGMLEELYDTSTYRNATAEEKADMVNRVYDYARDAAKREYLAKEGVNYTNATEDKVEVFKENPIKGAIENDLPVDEYSFSIEYPEKYAFFKENNISYETYKNADEDGKRAYTWAYENPDKLPLAKAVAGDVVGYRKYANELYDIKADKDADGKSISGSRKEKVVEYINNLDADYGERLILFKSEYNADDTYNYEIVEYLNSRDDISYEEMVAILKELGFTVKADGTIYW